MATGKQGFVRDAVSQHLVSAQRDGDMRLQAPLAAMYIHAVPGLPAVPLPLPMMCTSPAVPFLTLHVSGGAAGRQQKPEAAAVSARPKAAGKHVCLHCGRDCLKPSVLEKHLRCHTGERPYPCLTCGISFKTQSNLYKHKRTQAHARLCSQSGKGTFSSQDSTESSRETCPSPEIPSEDQTGGDASDGTGTVLSTQLDPADGRTRAETEKALRRASAAAPDALLERGQQESLNLVEQLRPEGVNEASSTPKERPPKAPSTPNRTPLQRQEAVVPKLSRGNTQSHGSTDSGFSDGSEPHLTSSPRSSLHDPSMEALAESSMELQEPGRSREASDVTCDDDDDKSKVSVQEKRKLEEHILKLISDNSVLVDDKHLLNVRPRKTVLSKQGSIDLPMPYTYKDSFHFEMRSSKHRVSSSPQDRRGRAFYSSVPTQCSDSLDHAPLTRSSSLPFGMAIQNSERTASPHQGDNVPLSRRCSAGSICTFKSVDQRPPGHRLLVRQSAVDCLTGAEISAVERGSHSSLGSDGDCADASAESAGKRCRRKKSEKFAYNKWYMYGGGTFKKLYDTQTGSLGKSRTAPLSVEQTESQGVQTGLQRESSATVSSCTASSLPPAGAAHPARTSSQLISSYVQSQLINQSAQPSQSGQANQNTASNADSSCETGCVKGTEEKPKGLEMQPSHLIPSERKKQKTEGDHHCVLTENTDAPAKQQCALTSGNLRTREVKYQSLQSECGDLYQRSSATGVQKDTRSNVHRQGSLTSPPASTQRQILFKRHSSPVFVSSESGTSACSSALQVRPSFLPMYQLKIPCFTDGASGTHLPNPPVPKPSSCSRQPAQQGGHEAGSPSVPPSQTSAAAATLGQEHQGTSLACRRQGAIALGKAQTLHQSSSYTSIIPATPTLASSTPQSKPVHTAAQKQSTPHTVHNTSSGPSSSVLSQPCQIFTPSRQNQSVTVSTTPSTVSLQSHSSTLAKTCQIGTATVASVVHSSPATSVVISKKPLDTHSSVCQSPTDSSSLRTSHAEHQGGQFEDRVLLNDSLQSLAQDTFYVRTADLQIVMQLISDEQLALIEPQIETQDFKLDGSHSFLHQDSETSQPDIVQTSASQEIHKQCSDQTMTKPCVSEANTKRSAFGKAQDVTPLSAVVTQRQQSSESSKDDYGRWPENIYLTKTGPEGVISRLHSKTARCPPSPPDSRANTLGQHCKTHEATHLEATGSGITVTSHSKQSPGVEAPPADTPTTKLGAELQPRGSAAHGPRKVSMSGEREHSSRGTTGGPGSVHMPLESLSRPVVSTERTPMSFKEKGSFWPDIPVSSDTSQLEDCQPIQTTAGQQKSCRLLSGTTVAAEGEAVQAQAEATCLSGGLLPRLAPLATAASQRQHKARQSSCSSPAVERTSGSGNAPAPVAAQHQALYPTGARGGDESQPSGEAQRNETRGSGQVSGQQLPQQACWAQRAAVVRSTSEQGKVLTARTAHVIGAHFSPHTPVSKGTWEDRTTFGETTGGVGRVNPGPCTGPWLGGSLHSPLLSWESGTGFQGWVPQEPKTGEEDIKREGTTDTPEVNQMAVNPDVHLTQSVTNVCHNTLQPAQFDISGVPHNYAPTLCGPTCLSHDVPALCQREVVSLTNPEQVRVSGGSSVKVVQEFISQSTEEGCDSVPSGCQERFTSVPSGQHHPTPGHSSSENVIHKDVQKESYVMNFATQSHSQISEHHRDRATESSVSTEPCVTLSPSNTATCGAINTMPKEPRSPCPDRGTSFSTPTKLDTHTNAQDPHTSQCHLGGSYLDEEGTSSSSDDEGKLVIELE
ncbi:zinc finger protein 831 [Brachyhypopomus gauderio]|uniref:zinc finger protein 831 n=1 Tax=Brachyhypopomus gauderio TaxID=698409 RepID=UPI0040432C2E